MTTKIVKRSITPPRDAPNRLSINQLKVAVEELSGVVGSTSQRAVRLCELLDAGLLELNSDGLVMPGADAFVRKSGDTMVGPLIIDADGSSIRGRSGQASLRFQNNVSGLTATDGLFVGLNTNGLDATIWNFENGYLRFATNNIERGRILADGTLIWSGSSGTYAMDVTGRVRTKGALASLIIRSRDDIREFTLYSANNNELLLNAEGLGDVVRVTKEGNVSARDITASRGDGTGVVYLNNTASRYLYFDGTKYNLPGADLFLGAAVYPGNGAGAHLVGNGSGNQHNGTLYQAVRGFTRSADNTAWIGQARTFVTSADPGAQAADGDLWIWTGFVKYRSGGAWVTAAT